MKLYIGYDYNNNPLSVLLADNEDKAHIAWAGMNDIPHHIEEIDPNQSDIGIHGVVFVLSSDEKRIYKSFSNEDIIYRKFKRGL